MGMSESELEHYADEVYIERKLVIDIYCGNCGYNLRNLPYVHACPECGQEYNARPTKMTGVYFPRTGLFPWGELTSALFSWTVAVLVTVGSFSIPVSPAPTSAPGLTPPPPLSSTTPLPATSSSLMFGRYEVNGGLLMFGLLFIILAIAFSYRTYRCILLFIKAQSIRRRVERDLKQNWDS